MSMHKRIFRIYHIYPKYMYLDILTTYHTGSKIWRALLDYSVLIVLKYCVIGIWSGSTLFSQACLSQHREGGQGGGGDTGIRGAGDRDKGGGGQG